MALRLALFGLTGLGHASLTSRVTRKLLTAATLPFVRRLLTRLMALGCCLRLHFVDEFYFRQLVFCLGGDEAVFDITDVE